MLEILHLHGFKCAGTTFAAILEQNFPEAVAYVESSTRGARLPWQQLQEAVDPGRHRAASSHLVTVAPAGIARMQVAFVRDPRARLRSAYRFQHRTGALNPPGISFAEFLQRIRTSTMANYQTRHLSPQDSGGWEQRKGWQLRPELIDLNRPDLFVGTVERFDESLVLLELRMAHLGVPFDAAYRQALNSEGSQEPLIGSIPVDAVELDETLHRRVSEHVTAAIEATSGFEDLLADFRERRALRAASAFASVPGPDRWLYLEPQAPGARQ